MYKKVLFPFLCLLLIFLLSGTFLNCLSKEKEPGWKVGVASSIITPKEAMWMAGYASREHPSEGKLHELKAKALAFEDVHGNQAVFVSADIQEGIPIRAVT